MNLWSLGDELWIPESTLTDIKQRHSDHRGRLEALITLWLEGSPSLTWRGVISTLESMWKYETAYSIRQYAEPLAGMSRAGFPTVLSGTANCYSGTVKVFLEKNVMGMS